MLVFVLTFAANAVAMDHSRWETLLKEYVSPESRVDYRTLKEHGLPNLDAYLRDLAKPWPDGMEPAETKAALINAYNALTIRWILTNYPVESIWRTKDPFRAVRHSIDNRLVSLDEIETTLRGMQDPRIHAALVCAARSCPPLRREAYSAARIDEQLDDNVRRWLADRNLNEFKPDVHTARVNPILTWYGADFEQIGGVREFVIRFAPQQDAAFLSNPTARIEFQPYNWGLNDASSIGGSYTSLNFYWDWAWNGYLWSEGKQWFLSLGGKYGVNPIIFGSIYIGAIPFFSLSVAWMIRNLRRGRSPVIPVLCASFCFVSAYLYLLIAGRNIPSWVYVFVAGMVAYGIYSTAKKIKTKMHENA
jgi:hypothetical protein